LPTQAIDGKEIGEWFFCVLGPLGVYPLRGAQGEMQALVVPNTLHTPFSDLFYRIKLVVNPHKDYSVVNNNGASYATMIRRRLVLDGLAKCFDTVVEGTAIRNIKFETVQDG
jgi:hypothetical protein